MMEAQMQKNLISIDFNPFDSDKDIEKLVVINESQREIWLSCMIGGEPATLAYNESISLKLTGSFSFHNFKKALQKVVERHEALRSVISANGEHFIIYQSLAFELDLVELKGSSQKEQADLFDTFLKNQMLSPIDLQEGPLFRVYVHQFSLTEHYFTIVIHHIICDGWSIGIILENLSKAYNAYQKGEEPQLPPVIQISTYAHAQSAYLKSKEFEETENFWLNIYKGDIPTIDLPTDFERGKSRTYKANRIDHKLSPTLVNQLKEIGGKVGCSLVNTMLSLFEIFLAQQTKQNDIVVGLPAAGQLGTSNYELVGHCVNILPIRSKLDFSLSFSEYLKKSKSVFLDAYDHQLFSFGQLLKKLNFKRESSRIPLVPLVFNIDMGMDASVVFDGLDYELHSNPRSYETFEIFLNATGTQDALILEWSYNTNLFKESTINRMIVDFEKLLNYFVQNPEARILESTPIQVVPIQNPIFNSPNHLYQDQNIIALMNEVALKNPNKVAISYKDQNITYQELYEQSNQLAQFLIKNNIGVGTIVALSTDRCIEMLISLIAILKSGAAYLPVDPSYPKDRIEFMLTDSGAKLLLTSKKYAGHFNSLVDEIIIEDAWLTLSQFDCTFNESIALSALSNVIYTSGTTGKPKGAKTTHKNLANLMTSVKREPGISASDKFLAITTISFDIAAVELFLPLLSGAEVVIADEDEGKDGRILLQIIENQNITILQATPSRWKMIIDSGWQKKYPITVFTAGEALSKDLAHELLDRAVSVWNLYGPTETTIYSTVKEVKKSDEVITIGKPVNNTNIYILDDNKKPLPINSIGEIYIGGEGVADGYLNRQQLTDEKFLNDPFTDVLTAKMYGTGDLGKILENGEILCLGRIDHQVKIRGYRIELGEIESVLTKQPGIMQAVVIAQEITASDKRLVAYLVVDENDATIQYENLTEEEGSITSTKKVSKETVLRWKKTLNKYLPSFMIPDYFITVKNFPLTPNAKIDRKALPPVQFNRSNVIQEKPLTEKEKLVANIWSEVLGVQNLKATDDFFELGGHSLLAIKVMVEIEKKTGTRLPLTVLFDHSSIADLAMNLDNNDHSEKWKSLIPIKLTGNQPPLYIVHGQGMNIIGFRTLAPELDENQPFYGLQAKGLNPDDDPLYDVEAIAAGYIEEMLQENPNGPFALMGYSAGGIIALEMSIQLKKLGKKVTFLGILDTYSTDNNYKTLWTKKDYKGIIDFTKNSISYGLSFLLRSPKTYLIHNKNFVLGSMYNYYKKFNPIKADKQNPHYILDRLQKAHLKAFDKYRMKQYDTPVFLFKANDEVMNYVPFSETNGLEPYINAKITVVNIPLGHLQFFKPPYVEIFAKELNMILNKINGLN